MISSDLQLVNEETGRGNLQRTVCPDVIRLLPTAAFREVRRMVVVFEADPVGSKCRKRTRCKALELV